MEKLSYTYDDIDYFGTESLDYLTSDRPIYDHYYMTKDKQGNDTKKYICLDSIYYSYPLRFSHIAKTVNNQLEASGKFYTGDVAHNYLGGYSFVSLMRDSYMPMAMEAPEPPVPEPQDMARYTTLTALVGWKLLSDLLLHRKHLPTDFICKTWWNSVIN